MTVHHQNEVDCDCKENTKYVSVFSFSVLKTKTILKKKKQKNYIDIIDQF